MGGDWIVTTLGDCVRFVSGGTPSKSNTDFWGGNIPWISAKDMKAFWVGDSEDMLTDQGAASATSLVPSGSTLLLVRGMTLHNDIPIVRVRRASTFNQDVKAVLPKAGVIPDYVPYLLLGHKPTLREKVDAAGHGTGRLALDALLTLPVRLPGQTVQSAIANLLGALDSKIELNRHITETLEIMALALFKSWFVDFDPVRAKAEARSVDLAADIAAIFPDSFSNDGLPEGWSTRPFSELFEISGGNTPRTDNDDFWGGPHQWATPKDLSSLSAPVLLQTGRSLTNAGLAQANSGLLPPGALLLSTRAPIGYLAFTVQPTAINQGFAGIVRRQTSTAYAWAWCKANMNVITGNAGGSTFPEISKAVLRQLPMLAPPQPVLDAFGSIADSLIERVVAITKESQTLTVLRNTLLPKLISGELCIADVEERTAAA